MPILKMKWLPAFIVSSCLAVQVAAQKRSFELVAVCFYNFENLFDPEDDPRSWGDDDFTPNGSYRYTEDIYQKKLHNLAFAINRIGTDFTPHGVALLGTAEIENARVLSDLVMHPMIASRNFQFVHFDSPDHRGIDVALLYQTRYFRPIDARPIEVDISMSGQKSGRTRDILYVSGLLAGDTVHILVNHWPSRRGGEAVSAPLRAIAANIAKEVSDSILSVNPVARIILMGDLNDDPVSPSVVQVLGATDDRSAVGMTGLYNPWTQFYKKGIGTLGYNDSWNLFDQIIISGNWIHDTSVDSWKYFRSEVYNRRFLTATSGQYKGYPKRSFQGSRWADGYSDHYPTVIYLIRTKQ